MRRLSNSHTLQTDKNRLSPQGGGIPANYARSYTERRAAKQRNLN
jgi:hypothetical protein